MAAATFDDVEILVHDLESPLAEEFAPSAASDDDMLLHGKIMIVDDEPLNIAVVQKFLQGVGYQSFVTTTDSTLAMKLLRREFPDVILLDIMMPQVSGLDLLREIRADPRLRRLPVIVMTAAADPQTKQRALEMGVNDFLSKPLDSVDLVLRVRNALQAKAYQDQFANYAQDLEQQVRARTAELAASRQEVILCLARACEFRDNETGNHVLRVGRYVGIIAKELGFSPERVETLEQAAQLHDVGKIGIPDAILLKPGKLTPEEFEVIQKHCTFGNRVMQVMPNDEYQRLQRHSELGARMLDVPSSPILAMAAMIALTHHERWDGTGYPLGLAGEDIPIEGRMTAVADVFDALSTKRPYKPALPRKECFAIMEQARGKQFDPRILDAFFRRREEIVQVQLSCADVA